MKRLLYTTLFLMAMLLSLVGTAGAAPVASGTAKLVQVEYVRNKGPVFTFEVSGKFSKAELKGTLGTEGGDKFDLYCTQSEKTTVVCNGPKKVSNTNVWLSWGGSTFWAFVPEAVNGYCYSVYDWNLDVTQWENFGTYCQDTPAQYGDIVEWYNPGWEDTFDYIFMPESPDQDWCAFDPVYDDAYYFPLCGLPY